MIPIPITNNYPILTYTRVNHILMGIFEPFLAEFLHQFKLNTCERFKRK